MADKKALEKRDFYKEKISKIEKDVFDEKLFKKFSVYELNELSKVLASTHDKFELKCLSLSYDAEFDGEKLKQISEENANIDKLCIKMKAKICERIEQIKSGMTEDSDADEKKKSKNKEALQSGKKTCEVENTWGMFDNKVETFSKFYENFTAAMEKASDLSEGEKYDLLLEALQSEAKNAIANLSYEKALVSLKNIYGSAYRQIQFHMHKLINVKSVLVASAKNLQSFYDEITQCEQQIKAFMPESDYALTFLVIGKLDKETSRAWERHRSGLAESWCTIDEASAIQRKKENHLPSFENFKAFLKSEINMWLGEESKASEEPNKSELCGATNKKELDKFVGEIKLKMPTFLQCKLCSDIHPMYKCSEFKAIDLKSKERFVSENNLCVKCLRHFHVGKCRDDTCNNECPKCSPATFHNSVLCPKNMMNTIKQATTKKADEIEEEEW